MVCGCGSATLQVVNLNWAPLGLASTQIDVSDNERHEAKGLCAFTSSRGGAFARTKRACEDGPHIGVVPCVGGL